MTHYVEQELHTVDSFDYCLIEKLEILKKKRGNPGTRSKRLYKDVICSFDIETSSLGIYKRLKKQIIEDTYLTIKEKDFELESIKKYRQSVMYIWQFRIGHIATIIGRTWEEFLTFLTKLTEHLDEYIYLCIYSHNLSYEFAFLSGIYDFIAPNVFAIGSRKVVKCEMMNHFEFRCSYKQTNMSLDEFTKKMNVEHAKKSGKEFDYTKERYSWTELTETELEYCLNDVIGLVEAIEQEMRLEDDNLYTIPLTSTGYVRRDVKRAMRNIMLSRVKPLLPDATTYKMLRDAFRGGDTHANRYYAGSILTDIKSIDRASSYPDVLCNCKYPVTRFRHVGRLEYTDAISSINKGKALLMEISIKNLSLIDDMEGCPYISFSKCRNMEKGDAYCIDNGRLITCEYLETTVTDIDLEIIQSMYKWDDIVISDAYESRYGYLPSELTSVICKYFKIKTELKGKIAELKKAKELNDDLIIEMTMLYDKSKALLNAIYGLMAQNPIKDEVRYEYRSNFCAEYPEICVYDTKCNGDCIFKHKEFITLKESITDERLDEIYRSKFVLPYQWGVWTTAHARYELFKGREAVGKENFVYSDTDSVKYIDVGQNFDELNNNYTRRSRQNRAYASDLNNDTYYMGVFENETLGYDKFVTMGAKKYCYEENGNIKLTLSGVSKKAGANELQHKGGIEKFNEDFIFTESGRTVTYYNDSPEIRELYIDGHLQKITKNIYVEESTYKLNYGQEYKELLTYLTEYRDSIIIQ